MDSGLKIEDLEGLAPKKWARWIPLVSGIIKALMAYAKRKREKEAAAQPQLFSGAHVQKAGWILRIVRAVLGALTDAKLGGKVGEVLDGGRSVGLWNERQGPGGMGSISYCMGAMGSRRQSKAKWYQRLLCAIFRIPPRMN